MIESNCISIEAERVTTFDSASYLLDRESLLLTPGVLPSVVGNVHIRRSKTTDVTVMPQNAERQLITGLQNGDAASFEQLVREYGGRLLAVARRYLPNEEDAQDCVQDAYILAFQRIREFEGRSSIGTWLHRIVVNTALMKIRARKRRREDSLESSPALFDSAGARLESETEITVSVEDVLLNEESRQSVRGYIDQLPETARSLVLLRDIEGYSTEEAAELTGMSTSNVKTGLHRGRKLLKLIIQKSMSDNLQASGDFLNLSTSNGVE